MGAFAKRGSLGFISLQTVTAGKFDRAAIRNIVETHFEVIHLAKRRTGRTETRRVSLGANYRPSCSARSGQTNVRFRREGK